MISGFFGIRSWYDLNRIKIANVPNYQLICYVKSEDEGPLLNYINGANRVLVAFQAAQVCIPEQILRTPHVRIYFKARTDDHPAETLHVAEMSHTRHVLPIEAAQRFAVFDVVEDDGAVERASRHAERVRDLGAVRDQIGMQLHPLAHLVFLGDRTDVPLVDLELFAGAQPRFVLGHEPYFSVGNAVAATARFKLVEELDLSTIANVEVEDVVRAENSVDRVSALRPKRIETLGDILVGDAEYFCVSFLDWHAE